YANQLAQGRYILSLDADEVVSPALRASLLAEKGRWRAQAYEVLRVAVYCGVFIRVSDWYPDWKVRLFAKGIAEWDNKPVHERLHVRAKPIRLEGELWHYTYATVEEHMQRNMCYARLAAQVLYEAGVRVRWSRPFLRGGARFLKSLILRGGWKAGWRGWSIALIGASNYFWQEIFLAEYWGKKH
ncbi:MAG: glycosyltransferase family 2 protein, partial [Bacteroidia bacterium]|nr:glycosyltransferase family 2 protein [Bacteroidia bacterium]MDW8134231.1 glycosyltransferase family 2 protein [Bacteroidia bacterium]